MDVCANHGYEDLKSKLQDNPTASAIRPPDFRLGDNGDGTENVKFSCGNRECGYAWYGSVAIGDAYNAVIRVIDEHRRSRHGTIA